MKCVSLAQDTDKWIAVVDTVMNVLVLKEAESLLTSRKSRRLSESALCCGVIWFVSSLISNLIRAHEQACSTK